MKGVIYIVVVVLKSGREFGLEDKTISELIQSLEKFGYIATDDLYIPGENVEFIVQETDY